MKSKLARIGDREALIITPEMKEQTGISGEVEVEIRGGSIVITPAGDALRSVELERQTQFVQARDRAFEEYDHLFRRLADA